MKLSNSNVAIIDFYHVDSPAAYINVLQPVCKQLIVITNATIKNHLHEKFIGRNENIKWEILPDDTEINRIQIENILSKSSANICLFSTIERNFNSFFLIFTHFSGIKLLVIHNANFWFKKKRKLKIFREPRNEPHIAKLNMIKLSSALIVLDQNIKKYITKTYSYNKSVICFSLAQTNENSFTGIQKDNLRIVVPGNIEESRKDFESVLNAFSLLPQDKTSLVLLGSPRGEYGIQILEKAASLKNKGYNIYTYNNFVDEVEFEKEMRLASLVLLPIQPETSFAAIREKYGQTKISGSVYDTIRYGKPGLIHSDFPLSESLSSRFIQYSGMEDLIKKIAMFFDKNKLEKEQERIAALSYWDEKTVRNRFVNDIENLQSYN